jgi:opacity protein-like surface antigen
MRSVLAVVASAIVLGGVAHAQGPAVEKGYVEGVAQSAFGNVTTQSYGVEFGATVRPDLQIFGEFGKIKSVASSAFTSDADTIAGALTQLQPASVAVSAKQPVVFFGGGAKYRPSSNLKVQPYVLGGVGLARVKSDVTFTLGGTEATESALAPFVTLGSDLSGTVTRPMLTLGAGATWPAWQSLIVDFQYRWGRIFAEDAGITTNRAGVGIGVRF